MEREDSLITVWSALADAKRRRIVHLLEEKPRTTGELCDFFEVSRYAVMKHLKVLEDAGLVRSRREGRQRWNILNSDLVRFLRRKLVDDDDDSYRLAEVLDLGPGRWQGETDAAPSTTHIEQSVDLNASPSRVFEALTTLIDAWWSERVSSDSQMRLEPFVNGRFYEAFGTEGQGALYATVTFIKQDEALRLRGPMGVDDGSATSHVSISLVPKGNATCIRLIHNLAGEVDASLQKQFERKWRTLLSQRLKTFVEERE